MKDDSNKGSTVEFNYIGYLDIEAAPATVKKTLESRLYNFREKSHEHDSGGAEEWFLFADKKLNEYAKFEIDIFMKAWNLKKVELIKEGKKKSTYQGQFTSTVRGTLILDHFDKFKKAPFLEQIQKLFHKYVIKHKIQDEWGDMLDSDMFAVNEAIRKALETVT